MKTKQSVQFTLLAQDGHARAGILHTPHGGIPTPTFAPVGTLGTVKSLTARQLRDDVGASLLLANGYHLELRPNAAIVAELGGLHQFMDWQGPLLTDSGGFQVFSLAKDARVDDDGVIFRSHLDGSLMHMTPQKSMRIQEQLGADIIMCFDECCISKERAVVERALMRTTHWARLCRETHPDDRCQTLFGIVQGGIFPDLRERSAQEIQAIGFQGYAIGGLAVGESKEEMHTTLDHTVPLLPTTQARYLMGVGSPEDLVEGVRRGVDIFDCVLPTRLARHGSTWTRSGTLNLRNRVFRTDERPISAECACYTCQRHSRAYLRHLIVAHELLAHTLLSLHNLFFLIQHMRAIRRAIFLGEFEQYARAFLTTWREESK